MFRARQTYCIAFRTESLETAITFSLHSDDSFTVDLIFGKTTQDHMMQRVFTKGLIYDI